MWHKTIVIFLIVYSTALQAHTVKIAGEIAGTWHIEPNHNPKANEPATAWIGLTRKGGKTLPLSETNCNLTVYSLPRKAQTTPILTPSLTAISAEEYQGIPSAEIMFPQGGLYELQLQCQPLSKGDFIPFTMTYQVTVAPGNPIPKPKVISTPTTTTNTSNIWLWVIFPVGLLSILGLGIIRRK